MMAEVHSYLPFVMNQSPIPAFVSTLQREIKSNQQFTCISIFIPFDLAPPFATNPTAKTTFVIYLARGNHLRKHIRTSLVVTKPTVQPTWVSALLEEIKCEKKVVPMHQ